MTTIGSRQLRAALAEYIRRAGRGERIVVTVDQLPVAQLGPLETPDLVPSTLEEAALAGLVQRPVIAVSTESGERLVHDYRWFPADVRVDRILRQVRG